MNDTFEVAYGSVIGTDHLGTPQVLIGKNNQDAAAVLFDPRYLVAVVCDGCGTGEFSEVGAHIGAKMIAGKLAELAVRWQEVSFEDMSGRIGGGLERIKQDVLAQIRVLALSMGGSFSETVANYFLFTVMATVMTKNWTVIFSRGDGVWALNSRTEVLSSGQQNEPAYLAYSLTGSKVTQDHPELLDFTVERFLPTQNVQQILLGSDGAAEFRMIVAKKVPGKQEPAGPLEQFFEDRFFTDPLELRRRLAMINTRKIRLSRQRAELEIEHGLLYDDTTIVAIRRRRRLPCTEKSTAKE